MNEMDNEFSFKCTKCGSKLIAIEDWEGMETTCPNCGKELVIPSRADAETMTETVTEIKVVEKHQTETVANTNANLAKCPACGKNVSVNASTCPHCGEPLKEQCWIVHDGGLDTILILGIINLFGHCKVNTKFAFVLISWIIAFFTTLGLAQNRSIFYWCERYSNVGLYAFLTGAVLSVLMSIFPFSRGKWYNVLSYVTMTIPFGIWAVPYLSV